VFASTTKRLLLPRQWIRMRAETVTMPPTVV
jgi:hypothetical protein